MRHIRNRRRLSRLSRADVVEKATSHPDYVRSTVSLDCPVRAGGKVYGHYADSVPRGRATNAGCGDGIGLQRSL